MPLVGQPESLQCWKFRLHIAVVVKWEGAKGEQDEEKEEEEEENEEEKMENGNKQLEMRVAKSKH